MTLHIHRTINEIAYRHRQMGIYLPEAYKRRDPREPRHAEKQEEEDKLSAAWRRLFNWQAKHIREGLMKVAMPPAGLRSHITLDGNIEFEDEDFRNDKLEASIISILVTAVLSGVDVAIDDFLDSPQIDWTDSQVEAAKVAAEFAGDLIKGVNETTKKAVKAAVEDFITTPGMTIKDVMDRIPLGEARSLRIATTEITSAFAQGQLEAGAQLQAAFPDVQVVKQWFTNRDALVCPICAPLDGVEVGINEQFDSIVGSIDGPDAHVNCRCWIRTRTRI